MNEYGLTRDLVCAELLRLEVSNYSYTDKDHDTKRGGDVWIFGQIFIPANPKNYIEVYVKLKFTSRVVCLSFHEKDRDINYPYL
ncbi:hypothetical protein Dtox_2896 [Desulfofarcimen acetoxidans DSM 771]|uniref:Toxin n=1 Tax=Desulfofarcimen acetoxidans (strain ATCC 49208 / DSM 771 / KCTC 5769 / VKM B-1644 / 5575) TaxID=485916 RepID=C8W2H5_DESAS|nr:hypothetical protein Dtox_2896 [Desulfofarcimen acetoxidans DSM 771]